MNKKGFMMAELVVVSAIVLTFLAGIFVSYNKIYSAYIKRLNYYDTITLYRLSFYRDYYNLEISNLENQAKSGVVEVSEIENDNYNEKVFLIYNSKNNLSSSVLDDKTINKTYKEYVNYLSTSVDLKLTNYVLILERCQKSNIDDCKYAYLEVYDEA